MLFFFFSTAQLAAQRAEQVSCRVSLDKTNLNATNIDFVDDLARQMESYINEFEWDSDIKFEEYEVIKMTMRVILLAVDENNNFQANLLISISRPIYNTVSETVLTNYLDTQWSFNFTPNTAFIHDERVFNSITSTLDFYALYAMGLDADTFSERGGQEYYKRALNVAILGESSGAAGWTSSERTSRRSLIRNVLNPTFDPYRLALYTYHYEGLDQFTLDQEKARQGALKAMQQMLEARRNNSELLLIDTFFSTKYVELVNVFIDGPTDIRLEAYNLLVELDNSHISEYDKLQ